MTIEDELEVLAKTLSPSEDEVKKYDEILDNLKGMLRDEEGYAIAKIWKTAEISPTTETGTRSGVDAVVVIDTDRSIRDLAEIFYEDLKDVAVSQTINVGVRVDIDGLTISVIPKKYAAQGTIGVEEEDYLYFSEIIGQDKLFQDTSRLLQHWQYTNDLDLETQALFGFEIEATLAHLFSEEKPNSLEEALGRFFEYAVEERFASQLNIFDKHNNVLMYHIFKVPEKQYLLEATIKANELHGKEEFLSVFGISN